jgi:hypothetical protein
MGSVSELPFIGCAEAAFVQIRRDSSTRRKTRVSLELTGTFVPFVTFVVQ